MITAREYLRVSTDRSGRERSPEEQHTDNAAAAAEIGATLGEPYRDIGSASRYAKTLRDDFPRLMNDLRTGTFGADVLMLWESSRGSRKTGEWCELIDVCKDQGVKIHVTSHRRTYDPGIGRDRKTLRDAASDAEYTSDEISAAVLRGLNANAANGRPHGTCPFGFKREYQMIRGSWKPVRQYPHPEEAPLIVELFERIKASATTGESFKSIARDWAARGIVGRRGRPFSHATLRDMITKVHYVGQRTHNGGTVPAAWDALVSDAVFREVQRIVKDPSRRTNTGTSLKHTLSMTIRCDVCGGPMAVRARTSRGRCLPPGYECQHKGCARINKVDVDAFLIGDAEHPGVILSYLARPDVYEALAPDQDGGELAEVRAELAKLRGDIEEMEAEKPRTLTEARILARSVEGLEGEIKELEEREQRLTAPNRLASLFPPGEDVAARWEATPIGSRRAVAAMLLAPEVLGEVRITRSPSPGLAVPVEDRIRWRRAN